MGLSGFRDLAVWPQNGLKRAQNDLKWVKSVENPLKAEHYELKAPENGLLVHPFPERVD